MPMGTTYSGFETYGTGTGTGGQVPAGATPIYTSSGQVAGYTQQSQAPVVPNKIDELMIAKAQQGTPITITQAKDIINATAVDKGEVQPYGREETTIATGRSYIPGTMITISPGATPKYQTYLTEREILQRQSEQIAEQPGMVVTQFTRDPIGKLIRTGTYFFRSPSEQAQIKEEEWQERVGLAKEYMSKGKQQFALESFGSYGIQTVPWVAIPGAVGFVSKFVSPTLSKIATIGLTATIGKQIVEDVPIAFGVGPERFGAQERILLGAGLLGVGALGYARGRIETGRIKGFNEAIGKNLEIVNPSYDTYPYQRVSIGRSGEGVKNLYYIRNPSIEKTGPTAGGRLYSGDTITYNPPEMRYGLYHPIYARIGGTIGGSDIPARWLAGRPQVDPIDIPESYKGFQFLEQGVVDVGGGQKIRLSTSQAFLVTDQGIINLPENVMIRDVYATSPGRFLSHQVPTGLKDVKNFYDYGPTMFKEEATFRDLTIKKEPKVWKSQSEAEKPMFERRSIVREFAVRKPSEEMIGKVAERGKGTNKPFVSDEERLILEGKNVEQENIFKTKEIKEIISKQVGTKVKMAEPMERVNLQEALLRNKMKELKLREEGYFYEEGGLYPGETGGEKAIQKTSLMLEAVPIGGEREGRTMIIKGLSDQAHFSLVGTIKPKSTLKVVPIIGTGQMLQPKVKNIEAVGLAVEPGIRVRNIQTSISVPEEGQTFRQAQMTNQFQRQTQRQSQQTRQQQAQMTIQIPQTATANIFNPEEQRVRRITPTTPWIPPSESKPFKRRKIEKMGLGYFERKWKLPSAKQILKMPMTFKTQKEENVFNVKRRKG